MNSSIKYGSIVSLSPMKMSSYFVYADAFINESLYLKKFNIQLQTSSKSMMEF